MKVLKGLAITLVIITLAGAGCIAYLLHNARVEVVAISSNGVSAGENPEEFAALVESVKDNSFVGTLYQTPLEWKNAEDYVYLTYTVKLKNNCLVPIDMVEVQIVPLSSDILQFGDLRVKSLNENTEGDFTAKILAAKNTHTMREVIVTYYVWGVSFSMRTASGLQQ